MRVVVDKYIPFVAEKLAPYADILSVEPEKITPLTVKDADALIIRTRTRADSDLLKGSKVQFIATATIGYDHIDTTYCEKAGIKWISCPGCNAQAVCDYVEAALEHIATLKPLSSCATLGVVGYGHIGMLVAEMAKRKGLQVLVNDPPKNTGVSIGEIEEICDFITFHTPLTFAPNPYPTRHLCDAGFLSCCKPDAVIINAARGGIVDERALLAAGQQCVIDCWENEPYIYKELLRSSRTILASYHIAGYSWDGKINASQMCLDGFCKHFGLGSLPIEEKSLLLQPEMIGDSAKGWLQRVSDNLKAQPDAFEKLRKNYLLR